MQHNGSVSKITITNLLCTKLYYKIFISIFTLLGNTYDYTNKLRFFIWLFFTSWLFKLCSLCCFSTVHWVDNFQLPVRYPLGLSPQLLVTKGPGVLPPYPFLFLSFFALLLSSLLFFFPFSFPPFFFFSFLPVCLSVLLSHLHLCTLELKPICIISEESRQCISDNDLENNFQGLVVPRQSTISGTSSLHSGGFCCKSLCLGITKSIKGVDNAKGGCLPRANAQNINTINRCIKQLWNFRFWFRK